MDPVTGVKIASIAIPAIASLFGRKKKDPTEDLKKSSIQGLAGLGNRFSQRSNQVGGQLRQINPQYNNQLQTTVRGLQRDPYAANMYDSLYGRGVADANAGGQAATARALSQFGASGAGIDNSRAAGITSAIQALTMGQIGNLANKLNIDRADRVNRNNLQANQLLGNERSYLDSRQSGYDAAQGNILAQLAGYGQNAQLLNQQRQELNNQRNAGLYGALADIAAGLFTKPK